MPDKNIPYLCIAFKACGDYRRKFKKRKYKRETKMKLKFLKLKFLKLMLLLFILPLQMLAAELGEAGKLLATLLE